MNKKQLKTISEVFENPVRANIAWRDIEAALVAAGAEVEERAGSRVCIIIGTHKAVFHRPHPQKETRKYAVEEVRRFLLASGVITLDANGKPKVSE